MIDLPCLTWLYVLLSLLHAELSPPHTPHSSRLALELSTWSQPACWNYWNRIHQNVVHKLLCCFEMKCDIIQLRLQYDNTTNCTELFKSKFIHFILFWFSFISLTLYVKDQYWNSSLWYIYKIIVLCTVCYSTICKYTNVFEMDVKWYLVDIIIS